MDLGGVGDGFADLLQGAVGAAGGVAGDIVNTPGDALGKLAGRGNQKDARQAAAATAVSGGGTATATAVAGTGDDGDDDGEGCADLEGQ